MAYSVVMAYSVMAYSIEEERAKAVCALQGPEVYACVYCQVLYRESGWMDGLHPIHSPSILFPGRRQVLWGATFKAPTVMASAVAVSLYQNMTAFLATFSTALQLDLYVR